MSTQLENIQESSPLLEERKLEADMRIREIEIALKRDQLATQKAPDMKTKWSPSATTILVAVAGMVASAIGALLQVQSTRELERSKFEGNLILKVIETGDLDQAAKNLRFLVKAGFITDDSGKISKLLDKPDAIPFLPSREGLPELSPITEERFYKLGDDAKKYFKKGRLDEAKQSAEEQNTLLPQLKNNWNYGNAVQDINLVLGRIAVKQDRIADAKRYLLLAGQTPGSPQLDTFGPNVSLASDLIKKGEREVVLKYFELCRKFWKLEDGRLDKWKSAVQAGQTPDFGANLVY
ncbi:hypothetical protein ACXX82_22980 [Glaciimonas sp. GNP009]